MKNITSFQCNECRSKCKFSVVVEPGSDQWTANDISSMVCPDESAFIELPGSEKTLPREMLVWNHTEPDALLRNVVYIHGSGQCTVINPSRNLAVWEHCKEIPEPEYRAFKPGEMTGIWADKKYRKKGAQCPHGVYRFSPNEISPDQLHICGNWVDNDTLFTGWEAIESDGSVSVIGVKL